MKHLTAFLLCLAALISPASAQESAIANVKFAMRLADDKPGDDRIEVQVEGSDATIYLHKSSVLNSGDVVSAKVKVEDYGPQIMIEFSEDGGTKMFEATSQNMGKFLAIIADGKVIVAPRIQAAISNSAAFTGDFTEAEAERLAAIIRGDDPQSAIVSPIAGTTFEMRLAWEKPGPELIEVVVGDIQRKLYLDKAMLSQGHIKTAFAAQRDGAAVINVGLLPSGARLLFQETSLRAQTGAHLAVIVDGRVIFAPKILEPISSPVMISGDFSMDEAKRLAAVIEGPRPSASLLLIKTDWSLAKDPSKVAQDVRLLLKDESVDPKMLKQLPKNAGELVLFNEMSSEYSPQQFSELMAWLQEQDLIVNQIPLSDFVGIDFDHPGRLPEQLLRFSSQSNILPEKLGWESLASLSSQSLHSQRYPEFEWNVTMRKTGTGIAWEITRVLHSMERFRGRDDAEKREVLDQGSTGLSSNRDTVSLVNAFPGEKWLPNELQHSGCKVLLVLHPHSSKGTKNPRPLLHLPQQVGRPKINESNPPGFLMDFITQLSADRADRTANPTPQAATTVNEVQLLSFTASYCQPCQQMIPVLKRMQVDQLPVTMIDITNNPNDARQYKVDRIPTHVLLVDGKETARLVGVVEESELRDLMSRALERAKSDTKIETSEVVASDPNEDVDRLRTEFATRQNELNDFIAAMKSGESASLENVERINAAVSELFDLRQNLRHAELAQMSQRIQESRVALTAQAKIKAAIVDKRVAEFLAEQGSSRIQPTDALSQVPPPSDAVVFDASINLAAYKPVPGDLLAIHIPQITSASIVPIRLNVSSRDPSGAFAVGYPFLVMDDGRVDLPYGCSIDVSNRTMPQIAERIRVWYEDEQGMLTKGTCGAMVSLLERSVAESSRFIKAYRIQPGDTLGIHVANLSPLKQNIPAQPSVFFPKQRSLPAAMGVPYSVLPNGAVDLPIVGKVEVAGLSLSEARIAIIEAYTTTSNILQKEKVTVVSVTHLQSNQSNP